MCLGVCQAGERGSEEMIAAQPLRAFGLLLLLAQTARPLCLLSLAFARTLTTTRHETTPPHPLPPPQGSAWHQGQA